MTRSHDLTPEQIELASNLRKSPLTKRHKRRSWKQIAQDLGVTKDAILRHFDPAQYARRHDLRPKRKPSDNPRVPDYSPWDMTLTARTFGDPPPGRSALDRRNQCSHA